MSCRHHGSIVIETYRPFTGPVNPKDRNPAADGNVTITLSCECGKIKRVNVNGRHTESSKWSTT